MSLVQGTQPQNFAKGKFCHLSQHLNLLGGVSPLPKFSLRLLPRCFFTLSTSLGLPQNLQSRPSLFRLNLFGLSSSKG